MTAADPSQASSAVAMSAAGEHRTEPCDVFLTATDVIARYGWGRTKGYRVLRSEGFPTAIGGDRYRLDTLLAWEEAQLHVQRRPTAIPELPSRKRVTRMTRPSL